MNKAKTFLNKNWGFKNFLILSSIISSVVVGVFMFIRSQATADVPNCSPVFTSPILNPYPLTFTNPGEPCHDFPALSARVINGGHYANSQSELDQGITANPGDEIYVRLYIHNGAAPNLDPETTNARNVTVSTSLDENNSGTAHQIRATLSSDNTNTIDKTFNITTPAGTRIVAIPNSGELFDFQANCIGGACQGGGFNVANSSFKVGEQVGNNFILRACFEQSLFVRFKVRVEAAPGAEKFGEIHQSKPITQINAQNCQYTSEISWSTRNIPGVEVTVRDPITFEEKTFAKLQDGSGATPWLFPPQNYRFTLWDITSGQRQFVAETSLNLNNIQCGLPTPTPGPSTPTPTPPTPTPATPTPTPVKSGEIHQSKPITQIDALTCKYTSEISWSTINIPGVEVTVRDPDTFEEKTFARLQDGSGATPWLFPAKFYRFTLWDITNGQRQFVAETAIDMRNVSCNPPTPTPATPTPTPATPTPSPALVNNSVCVAVEAPDVVFSGQSFTARVTVRNIGNTTWAHIFNYRLASDVPADNFTWGLNRVSLSALTVNPGESTAFIFNAVAPNVSGDSSFPFAWRMIRENVERFGPICAKQIAVRPIATPTPTPTPTPTITFTPTPTITPTPTPTITFTPTPTITPTPTPPIAVIPEVSKTADNTMVRIGDTLTYTIRVRNNQSVPFTLTGMHDQLPNEVILDRFIENGGNITGNIINWPNMEINPGATKFFRYQVRVVNGSNLLTFTNFATGNECFSFGCFPFNVSAAVLILGGATPTPTVTFTPTPTITFTPTPTPISGLYTVTKSARNISQNGNESKSITATIGDTVQFRIQIVTGGVTVTNVRLTDPTPFGFAYISGTTTINGSQVSSNPASGLFLGSLSPNTLTTVTVQGVVQNEALFNLVPMNVTNTAFTSADNAPSLQDSATITVSKTTTVVTNRQISLEKLGKDITKGEDDLRTSVTAAPGDTLEFALKVKATSGNLSNIVVNDILPDGVTYINNTTSLNGIIISNGITTSSGVNIGSLSEGQEAVVKFNAVLADSSHFSQNTTSLTNVAQARADNVGTVTAQLPISVSKGGKVAGASISRVSGVPTGPIGSITFSLLLSALATYIYMIYTKTGLFQKREAWAVIRKFRSNKDKFNFANK